MESILVCLWSPEFPNPSHRWTCGPCTVGQLGDAIPKMQCNTIRYNAIHARSACAHESCPVTHRALLRPLDLSGLGHRRTGANYFSKPSVASVHELASECVLILGAILGDSVAGLALVSRDDIVSGDGVAYGLKLTFTWVGANRGATSELPR